MPTVKQRAEHQIFFDLLHAGADEHRVIDDDIEPCFRRQGGAQLGQSLDHGIGDSDCVLTGLLADFQRDRGSDSELLGIGRGGTCN